jgi:putative ABC transport system substrate-binding protein
MSSVSLGLGRQGNPVITRRRVSLATALGLLGLHRVGRAQPTAAMRRIGVLSVGPAASNAPNDAFRQGMRELDWLEGRNVEYRIIEDQGDSSRIEALVEELIAQQVEVIVTGSAAGTRAAQRATKSIPIVMAFTVDAVGNGLVSSLARPGGNTTGVSNQLEDVFGKLIEHLHAAVPRARRIAVLLNEDNPSHVAYWSAAERSGAALGLAVLRVPAGPPARFGAAVDLIVAQKAQALVVHADPLFSANRGLLAELVRPTRLPVAYSLSSSVREGGLLSYGPDLLASYRSAAKYVDKILKGAKAADLPVEQPTRFELVINLTTAKALGVTIPQSLLLRADGVIQ